MTVGRQANSLVTSSKFDATAATPIARRRSAWSGAQWLPAHKPMGHINRARRFVYAASRSQRAASEGAH